jgi:hypothetical protein
VKWPINWSYRRSCPMCTMCVSQLKKCLCVPEEQIPMEDLNASEDLSYQEYPIKILETSDETRGSRCARCNGGTILRKKLLGKERKS